MRYVSNFYEPLSKEGKDKLNAIRVSAYGQRLTKLVSKRHHQYLSR
jgi:hypothetical protein